MIIKIWFFRKLSAVLSYWLEWAFENGRYTLCQKLYCWRLKVDRLLVDLVLSRHFRELKK